MAHEARTLRRQKIRYNNTNDDLPITWQLVEAGEKKTPSVAPTIEVFAPNNTTAILAATNMTLSGTIATYSIDTTTTATWPVATGYRAHIVTTTGGVTFEDDVMFDVAKYALRLAIGVDQLVDLDERVAAMAHNNDEDFSRLIEAVRDELQTLIESRVIDDKRLLESMILDQARVAVPARFLILSRIFEEKKDYDHADRYRDQFDTLWRAVLSSIQYDTNEDLSEDARIGGVGSINLVY